MGLRAARLAVALTVLCFLLQVESSQVRILAVAPARAGLLGCCIVRSALESIFQMQTRCMEGRWWGPNSIGEDSLIVAARSALICLLITPGLTQTSNALQCSVCCKVS